MSDKSFKQNVREHLEAGQTLTRLEAFELYGGWKLPARIAEFRQAGMDIRGKMETNGDKRFKRYWLEDDTSE